MCPEPINRLLLPRAIKPDQQRGFIRGLFHQSHNPVKKRGEKNPRPSQALKSKAPGLGCRQGIIKTARASIFPVPGRAEQVPAIRLPPRGSAYSLAVLGGGAGPGKTAEFADSRRGGGGGERPGAHTRSAAPRPAHAAPAPPCAPAAPAPRHCQPPTGTWEQPPS